MEKVTKKVNIEIEEKQNLKYWLSRPASERISAVQELREQYIILNNRQKEYAESKANLRTTYQLRKQFTGRQEQR